MIAKIADEFRAAGWAVLSSDEPYLWLVKPNIHLPKQYFLMPYNGDWVLSSPTRFQDPDYNEALNIINRARLKAASDRQTNPINRALAHQDTSDFLHHNYKGNMMHFVKINNNRFINFASIHDVSIIPEDESESENDLSVMVTYTEGECEVDTFVGEAARKIIAVVESLSAINNVASEVIDNEETKIANPPEELT
ncbi:hypothetical protein [Microseira wollei]|uniref:Uncharacterized protein n=1 Tax=Microseira wollei NIES-4236 TaxID=2530354 RepID=A0AAV3XHP3_9CYAN|nr:hypothetical protein [Microseira wollei]GET40470.1 hypothetical protein MiSe_52790 [Microseira wollei NIES-4236]